MSFLIRASIVIGLLSYFAAGRERMSGDAFATPELRKAEGATIAAIIEALPSETRERVVRAGADEVTRRAAATRRPQDTLSDADRRLPWRGP